MGLSRISAWGLIEPFAECPFTIFGISPALPMAVLGLILLVILVPLALKPANPPQIDPKSPPATDPPQPEGVIERRRQEIKRGPGLPGMEGAEKVSRHSTGEISGVSPAEALADRMQLEAAPAIGMMVDQISLMLDRAESLDEFREMLMAGFPKLHAEGLAQAAEQSLNTWIVQAVRRAAQAPRTDHRNSSRRITGWA